MSSVAVATCINNNIKKAVVNANQACFSKCTSSDQTSDCWITCFFEGVFAMGRDAVIAPFEQGFASDDPAKGGCPSVVVAHGSHA